MTTARRRRRQFLARAVQVGDRRVFTLGLPHQPWQDLYHQAMTVTWTRFIGVTALVFIAINAAFALLYGCGDQPVANLNPPGLLGLFFFSVETYATVGFGDMHPQTPFGHIVATIEIFSGLVSTALTTGVIFARFARPRSRILFARHPVVTPMDGHPSLIIRAANARQNVIVDASARLRLLMRETTAEGETLRRIHDLPLVRDQHPIFLLGWQMVHRITPESPLYGLDAATLADREGSLILTMTGNDETTGQTMQARENYNHERIRWNHRYQDLFVPHAEHGEVMDYRHFHSVVPDNTPR